MLILHCIIVQIMIWPIHNDILRHRYNFSLRIQFLYKSVSFLNKKSQLIHSLICLTLCIIYLLFCIWKEDNSQLRFYKQHHTVSAAVHFVKTYNSFTAFAVFSASVPQISYVIHNRIALKMKFNYYNIIDFVPYPEIICSFVFFDFLSKYLFADLWIFWSKR